MYYRTPINQRAFLIHQGVYCIGQKASCVGHYPAWILLNFYTCRCEVGILHIEEFLKSFTGFKNILAEILSGLRAHGRFKYFLFGYVVNKKHRFIRIPQNKKKS